MSRFMIKSSDSYGDKNYEIVRGEIKYSDDWIIYNYESRLGKCEVHFSDHRVIISRKGEISTVIDVDLNRTTKFLYVTKEMRKELTVSGERIVRNAEAGVIEFSYKLYDNDIEINRITISIKNY
ncbi:DUF1934 family protein [Fusobacterium sp.]|uniref:DUF1934 family protein n=1 Tax=Fusobacterium sp. TaxID=68766 RepID=UPI00396C560C